MKKRLLSIALAFTMMLTQVPVSSYGLEADPGSGITGSSGIAEEILLKEAPVSEDSADSDVQDADPAAGGDGELTEAIDEGDEPSSSQPDETGAEDAAKSAEQLDPAAGTVSETIGELEEPEARETLAAFEEGSLSLLGQIQLKGSSPASAVIGSAENPFLIGTPEVLAELGELTQSNEAYGTDLPFAAASYKLVADIDLAGVDGMQRIDNFTGTFDGDGHVIKNMKTAGLFATAKTDSVIKNLGIEDCKISCEGSAGGVAAYTDGTIINCYVTGTITGTAQLIGGVVGKADDNALITNCYAAVNVSGVDFIGGVVGRTTGTVTNCYVTGNVSGSSRVGGVVGVAQDATIANCYVTGNVSAIDMVGGVVGWAVNTTMSTVTNCAALGQTVTGNSYVGRVVGCNSASTISGCHAFSGMKVGASGSEAVVTGGAADNTKGADLSYTESKTEGAKLSAQFSEIFHDDGAWDYTEDGLPTLNSVNGGQSSELPAWFTVTSFNLSTAEQLNDLRKVVNGEASAYGYINTADVVYTLINDIDLAGFDSDSDTTNGSWTPIGNFDNQFKGTFDGNSHAIKNMTINLSNTYVGLFGYTAEGSAVRNVGVESGTVTGSSSTGGVVGAAFGTVTNCYNTGSVTGTGVEIGGVVGTAHGAITNCYATGSVNGDQFVGGVAGHAYAAITNCYATGNVSGSNFSGGVVGLTSDALTNCYATGSVSGSNCVGGVAGIADHKVTNCAALGQTVTGSGENIGRIAGGLGSSGTAANCYAFSGMKIGASGSEAAVTGGAADNKNGADYTGGNPEFSEIFNGDTAWNFTSGALPTLKDAGGSQSSALPVWLSGGSSNIFEISTAAQLDELRQLVNNNTPSESGYTNTAESCYSLAADIDLAASGSVTPIGLDYYMPFKGTFDGKGNAVRNMTVASSEYAGLFGYTAENSTIKNLGVESCNVTGENAGGVVGNADGAVTSCYSTGTVTTNGSAGSCVGGVVGNARGTVTNCYSTCSVSGDNSDNGDCVGGVVGSTYGAVTGCYATGSVSGGNTTGGVVGQTFGRVTNCYFTGSISGGGYFASGGVAGSLCNSSNDSENWVKNCYSTGSVSGTSRTGGVVGCLYSSTGTVTNCAALGKNLTAIYSTGRIVADIQEGTVSNCYAWSGMSLSGGNIGDNGTDLTYTAANTAGARLSAQLSAIFGSDAAWNYTADGLPVLAGTGGSQSSDLPYWVVVGFGTEANPYLISTAAQLNDLRKVVNDGAASAYGYTNAADRFYKLTANISLGGFDSDENSANGNWTPIGTNNNRFLGSFDGNGFAVKQMKIDLSAMDFVGLFGCTAEGSVIQNLGVENCSITGQYYTGGMVGFAYGTVTGCYTTGTIDGEKNTGGVAGRTYGMVKNCYATGSVTGIDYVGGVVGSTSDSVTGCYATGNVTGNNYVGGVAGNASDSVISCVALGKIVTGDSATTGRIAGGAWIITDCYAWRYMKIGASGSGEVVTDGAANSKNGADLLYLTGRGLLLGDELFTWPGFADGWDVPANQASGSYLVMPKLAYQTIYPHIPQKLVQVFGLTLDYNNGSDKNTRLYTEYGKVALPGKSDLADMTGSGTKVFVGWDPQKTIEEDTAPGYQAGDMLLVTKDTTLYAQWKTVSAALDGKDAETGDYEVASYYNTLLQNQTTLTLKNNMFKAADNLDIRSWFQNTPDWLFITLTAEAGSDTAAITFSGTPDSGSSPLWEPMNIPTSALTLPMDAVTITSDNAHVSIYKAKPTVTWATAAQSVIYTTAEPIITAPTVTLSGADEYSGGFEYSYKTEEAGTVYTNGLPTAVGTYYVRAHIDADYHGNYSAADSDTDLTLTIAYLQTDAVAIVEGTQGENGWYTGDVTLKAPDGYSIATANGSDASWVSGLPPINSDTRSDYTYYLRKDSGEITDAKTIAVNRDTTVPVIGTLSYSEHQSFLDWIFHKSVIRVTVPVTDSLSGADHISYQLHPYDGGTSPEVQTAVVDTDGNAVFDVEKTFKGMASIMAYDKAGNLSESAEAEKMAVEETAPTLSIADAFGNAFTENWYTDEQMLSIIANDLGSGIQSVTYTVDGGSATTLFEAKEADATIRENWDGSVAALEGAHTYTFTVTDNALNTTEQTLTIKQDTVSPTVDSMNADRNSDTTLAFTATASDTASGVKQYYLHYEAGEALDPGFENVKSTCITSTDGAFELNSLTRNTAYTVFIWAEDGAGNISGTSQYLVKTSKTSLEGAAVALGSSSFTYNGQSQTPSVAVTLGGETLTAVTDYTVGYSNSNGGENHTTDAGTVTVSVTAAESGNFSGTVTQTAGMTYTIAPAIPTVTWSETDKAQTVTYTGSPAVITAPQVTLVNSETHAGTIQYAYKKSDGLLNGLFAGYTDGLPTDAGKYLIKAHIDASGNYAAADSGNELELTIEKANTTLSITAYTGKTYDGAPIADPTAAQIESNITNPAVTYCYRLDYNDAPGSLLAYVPTDAGTYWVQGEIDETANTKAVVSNEMKFTIAKAPLTISGGTVAVKKWDGQATAPVESLIFSGMQGGESLTLSTDYAVLGAAYADAAVGSGKSVTGGTVALAAEGTAVNYTLPDATLSGKGLTGDITKAGGPTAPAFSAWDDAANTFTFNSTGSTVYEYRVNGGDWIDITAAAETTEITVGNLAVPAGGLEVRVKATDTHEAGALLTNTSEQVFTAGIEGFVSVSKTADVTYGDTLIAVASYYQTGAQLHYKWTADGSNVGTDGAAYTVQSADIGKVITVAVTAAGYTGSLTPAAATNEVLKRAITVTADAKSKTYGQADPVWTCSITSGSLINSDTLSGALSRAEGETPGTYAIHQGTLDNAAYAITYQSADLTIGKAGATLNVTVSPAAAKVGKTVTVTVSAVNSGSNLADSGWNQPVGVTLTGPDNSSMTLTPVNGQSGKYTANYLISAGTATGTELTFTAAVEDTTANYNNPQPQTAILTVTDKNAVKLTLTTDKTGGITYGDKVVYTARVEKNNPILDALDPLDGTVKFYLGEVNAHNLLATRTIGIDSLNVTLDSAALTKGDHTIYAVYSGNADFASATQSIITTIAAKELTWDVSDLTAVKKYDGNAAATVGGTLMVAGALEGIDPGFGYTGLTGSYDSAEAGSRTVTVTVAGAGLTNSNYALPTGTPTFTGKINAVSEILNVPESGNGTDYKLEQEHGVSEVPDTLKSNPALDTPAKIEAQMRVSVGKAMNGVETSNIEVYDITLLFSTDGGHAWQTAAQSNFPADGITVILPYPAGTNKGNYNFVITHMFTTGANAGSTETITPAKTDEGLKFTLHSLSPVAVGYKAVPISGGGHSGGNSTDDSTEFWQTVKDKISAANSGDVIKVNAKYYDRMPRAVMDTLRKNGVTLVVDWRNGKTITIPAGMAQQNEPGRIFWPLSKLEELYNNVEFIETAVPAENRFNPETGGSGYLAYASTGKTVPVTGSLQKVEAPIERGDTAKEQPPATATPSTEGMATVPAETAKNHMKAVAAMIALLTAAIGGCWVYRRKVTNK